MDVRFEQRVNIKRYCASTSPVLPWSLYVRLFCFHDWKKRLKGRRHENIEAKRLRRWSSQAFRKRQSPAAFRTCRNAGNSVLTAEGTTSKGTGSISCEIEFCIFYRLSLRTLWTKDVHGARFAFSVLYGFQNRQQLLFHTSLTDWFFVTVVESVYSAVRTDSLYKADYV
jgi:hypothetical protein